MTEAEIRLEEARWWHKITVENNVLYVRNNPKGWFGLGDDMKPLLDYRLAEAERCAALQLGKEGGE